jgi:hypothetical protein
MQISQRMAAFLQGPTYTHAGTRDAQNVPAHHLVMGLAIAPDREHVTLLIPEHAAAGLRENLADNGRVAISSGEAVSHENYQLKGVCTEVRPCTAADHEVQDRWQAALDAYLTKYGFPEAYRNVARRMKARPAVAVTFRIEEVFDQKPGPGAGERISS